MTWRIVSDQALHFRFWDDEAVVYNRLSGDTHLLGSAAAQLLLNLRELPSDATTLAAALAPCFPVAPGDDLPLQIEQLLRDLHALALIEPV